MQGGGTVYRVCDSPPGDYVPGAVPEMVCGHSAPVLGVPR